MKMKLVFICFAIINLGLGTVCREQYFKNKMNIFNLENINELCRVCLVKTNTTITLHDVNSNLIDLLISIVDFKVVDNFPRNICISCKEKLEIFYEVAQLFRQSQETLSNYYNQANKTCDSVESSLDNTPNDLQHNIDEIDEEIAETSKGYVLKRKGILDYSYDDIMGAIKDVEKLIYVDIKCIKCSFVGINMKALISHVSISHKELKLKWCSICNGEYDDLIKHRKKHEAGDLSCRFCNKNFSVPNYLIQHLLSHCGKCFVCDICNKNYSSKLHFEKHKKSHFVNQTYLCQACSKVFKYETWFKKHRKNCLGNKLKLNQDTLGEATIHSEKPKSNDLERREEVIQASIFDKKSDQVNCNVNPKKNKGDTTKLCNECGKQFSTASRLRSHLRIHSNDSPYACRFCSKTMTTRTHLILHERVHTGERPYRCNICDKSFNQSSILKTHSKIHNEKTEKCSICNKTFARPCDLKIHLRKHTGEKPFKCQLCQKAFIQRSHLVEHEKKHLNVKPYKCLYCERSFSQKSTLKTHIDIHLGIKPYQCNFCPYSARQSFVLKTHMVQHQKEYLKQNQADEL